MSILKKLFGSDKSRVLEIKTDSSVKPVEPSTGEMVKVFDEFGRMLQMPKETWRTQVLLPNLAAKRNDPEALNALIVSALRDGCAADALDSARHLTAVDPQPLRAANLLGVVLMQLKRPDEARRTLEEALTTHGEEGYVLTNLAKAYSGLGDIEKSDTILWRAIERDPNQDNGLLWFAAIHKERGGPEGQKEAFERAAGLPNSWRPQLWLAREALGRGDVTAAADLYRRALSRMDPIPADALMQISGDLGNSGQLSLLLDLCTPKFDLQRHGIQVGNNLIKANLDLGRTKDARALLEKLYAQQRPDWREVLTDWERRIDDAERRFGIVEKKIKVQFLSLDQPLCAHGRLGFEALLPDKHATAVRITFICGTATPAGQEATHAYTQRTDALGQVTRAIPIYLAEEIFLRYTAKTRVLIPVVEGDGGFVLLGVPWRIEDLQQSVRESEAVVLMHVDARTSPWQLKFSLLSWPAGSALSEWTIAFKPEESTGAIQAVYERAVSELSARSELKAGKTPSPLLLASPADVQKYIWCLETALVIGTANASTGIEPAIWGERPLIDSVLDLAVSLPASIRCRMLLLNAVEKEARRRPDIVKEYLEKLSLLQQRHPLPAGPAGDLVEAAMKTISTSAATN
jgi:tetratricopeptide (TPR) repeat protein